MTRIRWNMLDPASNGTPAGIYWHMPGDKARHMPGDKARL